MSIDTTPRDSSLGNIQYGENRRKDTGRQLSNMTPQERGAFYYSSPSSDQSRLPTSQELPTEEKAKPSETKPSTSTGNFFDDDKIKKIVERKNDDNIPLIDIISADPAAQEKILKKYPDLKGKGWLILKPKK